MRNKFLSGLVVTAAIVLSGCATHSETFFIISTNDIHGAIEKIPNLATLTGQYRSQDTASVFLLDAGDRWTGNSYVDMASEPGRPVMDLMGLLGYDAATFGNHEFDKGLAILDERTKEASFPVVLANIDTGTTPLSQPDPYIVLHTMGGRTIAVLGLIYNFVNGHPDGHDEIFAGTAFASPYETAAMYSHLAEENDMLIGLTHLGVEADSVLAVTVPAFDLIIGGHTHAVIQEPPVYGKTFVTQTGKSLRYAGITEVRMKGREVASINNRLVLLDTVAPDPVYQKLVDKYLDNEELNRPIGSFAGDVGFDGVANFFTDVIRKELDTDFGLYHAGGMRVHRYGKGMLSTADIFALEPFGSRAVKVVMTLSEIRQLIINKFNDTENPGEAHCIDIHPSGMNYTIVTDERGEAVDVTFDHRYAYEAGHRYTVAMADYIYKMYKFDKPAAEAESPLLTDIFIEYFDSNSPVVPDNRPRAAIRLR